MFYDKLITIPAGTLKSNPIIQSLLLTKGVVNHVEIVFPAGCHNTVSCVIMHQEHQLFPTNPDGSFQSDNDIIKFEDWFELNAEPYEVKIIAWSPLSAYDHDITVRIGVINNEVASLFLKAIEGLYTMLQLLGMKK